MSDPYKNRLDPKHRKASSTFVAPTKEAATTGRFMAPGDDYGIGHRTPVGKEHASDMASGPIPQHSKCMDPEHIHFKD